MSKATMGRCSVMAARSSAARCGSAVNQPSVAGVTAHARTAWSRRAWSFVSSARWVMPARLSRSSRLGLGESAQVAGTGHVGLCLPAASAQRPFEAVASLVVALCGSSYRKALAGDAGAAVALATGRRSLVVDLSASLESTRQASGWPELTATYCERRPVVSLPCACPGREESAGFCSCCITSRSVEYADQETLLPTGRLGSSVSCLQKGSRPSSRLSLPSRFCGKARFIADKPILSAESGMIHVSYTLLSSSARFPGNSSIYFFNKLDVL